MMDGKTLFGRNHYRVFKDKGFYKIEGNNRDFNYETPFLHELQAEIVHLKIDFNGLFVDITELSELEQKANGKD